MSNRRNERNINASLHADLTRQVSGNHFDADYTRGFVLNKFASIIQDSKRIDEWISMTGMMLTLPTDPIADLYILPTKWVKSWDYFCYGDLLLNPAIDIYAAKVTPRRHPGPIAFSELFEPLHPDQFIEQ